MAYAPEHIRALNETFLDQLQTPGLEKVAQTAADEFVRTQVTEDGVFRKVIPAVSVTNADLHPQVDTSNPVIVCEKEPGSAAALSVPFATLPPNAWIKSGRFRVEFARIVSTRYQADIDQLRTWRMDIRQVFSDKALRDILAEEDSKFFAAVNTSLVAADTIVPASGVIQWETLFGGISRDTLNEAKKIIPKTPSHLEAATAVANNVTIHEIPKWGNDEIGITFSEKFMRDGFVADAKFAGLDWIITIKRHLVADDSMFFFGDPDYIGKFFVLEEPSMHIKREAFMLSFFLYETLGATIAETGGLARADFA